MGERAIKTFRQILQKPFNHKTSKKDILNHGFGLSIIEDICEKNDGSCQWIDNGDTFDSVVMLRYQ